MLRLTAISAEMAQRREAEQARDAARREAEKAETIKFLLNDVFLAMAPKNRNG